MACGPLAHEYGAFFDHARQHRVIFYYVGYFSQNIIAAMAEAVKLQLEVSGATGPTRRKLFSSFIEMAQNIIHYSADALTAPSETQRELRHGSVCIVERDDGHTLLCANPVDSGVEDALRAKLDALRRMTLDEIKQAYKASLRADSPEGSKGAGMGFLTMARDARAPLDFDFHRLDGSVGPTVFCLKAVI